jgi:hypothetical protein
LAAFIDIGQMDPATHRRRYAKRRIWVPSGWSGAWKLSIATLERTSVTAQQKILFSILSITYTIFFQSTVRPLSANL